MASDFAHPHPCRGVWSSSPHLYGSSDHSCLLAPWFKPSFPLLLPDCCLCATPQALPQHELESLLLVMPEAEEGDQRRKQGADQSGCPRGWCVM